MKAYLEVVEELQSELKRQRISQDELARRLGHNQQWLSRRLRGEVPFELPTFYDICELIGVEPQHVVEDARVRYGRRMSRLPRRDSNLQPADYRFAA